MLVRKIVALVRDRRFQRSRNSEGTWVGTQRLNRRLLGRIHVTVETIVPRVARGTALRYPVRFTGARGLTMPAVDAESLIV